MAIGSTLHALQSDKLLNVLHVKLIAMEMLAPHSQKLIDISVKLTVTHSQSDSKPEQDLSFLLNMQHIFLLLSLSNWTT